MIKTLKELKIYLVTSNFAYHMLPYDGETFLIIYADRGKEHELQQLDRKLSPDLNSKYWIKIWPSGQDSIHIALKDAEEVKLFFDPIVV